MPGDLTERAIDPVRDDNWVGFVIHDDLLKTFAYELFHLRGATYNPSISGAAFGTTRRLLRTACRSFDGVDIGTKILPVASRMNVRRGLLAGRRPVPSFPQPIFSLPALILFDKTNYVL